MVACNFIHPTKCLFWYRKLIWYRKLVTQSQAGWKMRQKTIITKLLQVWQKFITKGVRYCKVCQVLQSVTDCYYKVRQVLQSATVITKWDVTMASLSSSLHFLMQLYKLLNFSESSFSTTLTEYAKKTRGEMLCTFTSMTSIKNSKIGDKNLW